MLLIHLVQELLEETDRHRGYGSRYSLSIALFRDNRVLIMGDRWKAYPVPSTEARMGG